MSSLLGRSILSIEDLNKCEVRNVLQRAAIYKELHLNKTAIASKTQFLVALLFFEPSTRTRCSFEAAVKRLGGNTITISDVASSSLAKGETLEDTVRTIQGYCDAIVLRHPEVVRLYRCVRELVPLEVRMVLPFRKLHLRRQSKGACQRIVSVLPPHFPVINAGDGAGEHPTQALLDLFTIDEHFSIRLAEPKEKAVVVTVIGDLKYGRTVHSLVKLLARYNTCLQCVAPSGLELPQSVSSRTREIYNVNGMMGRDVKPIPDITTALESSDVIYMTRIQKERLKAGSEVQMLDILHPLPRIDEIEVEVDSLPQQKYFQQAQNGMFVRQAVLALLVKQ